MKKEFKDILKYIVMGILAVIILAVIGVPALIYYVSQDIYRKLFGLSKDEYETYINEIFPDMKKLVLGVAGEEMDFEIVIDEKMKDYHGSVNPVKDTFHNAISNLCMEMLNMNERSKTYMIYLKPHYDYETSTKVLIHELRHHWQFKKHGSQYFADYVDYSDNKKAYRNHPSEVDADKYTDEMMKTDAVKSIMDKAIKKLNKNRVKLSAQ